MTEGPEDRLICRCFVVPESAIRRAVAAHDLRLVDEVTAATRAGGGCSSCWDEIQGILDSIHGRAPSRHEPDASGLSAAQKRELVLKTLDGELQGLFDLNGLSMQVVDVGGDRVLARLGGDGVGTTAASFLALKRHAVARFSAACGQKMSLVELNVLEGLPKASPA